MPLYSCAIYISSGLASVASRAAAQAARVPRCAVVDTFTDSSYARSSVKLVAERAPLLEAARCAVSEALSLVDLSREPHPAPHPRCGAVDMVAFMPLSDLRADAIASELADCDGLAWELGERLGELGGSVLMYGKRAERTLLEARRGTSFFASTDASVPRDASATLPLDFGAPLAQARGVSVVGAMPYVTNFNVRVGGASLAECRAAAAALRSQMSVQVMALPYGEPEAGAHEIGCNLQATSSADTPTTAAVLELIASRLPSHASVLQSYVIGMMPADARARGEAVLASNP